ncbi:hypothetical protein MHUMG1_10554 [Metarhizium humberi]|uniref:Uncharacterized protein n=1 Tax=Metarhizium humberi TaxID=2596975 RepID=A0A9P8S301_9HYPO|nr:hypothetical protein MHUMG1_10554 [Metarhizium humberi]
MPNLASIVRCKAPNASSILPHAAASNTTSDHCCGLNGLTSKAGDLVESESCFFTLVRSKAGAGIDSSIGEVDRVDLWSVGGGGALGSGPDSRAEVFSPSTSRRASLAESSWGRQRTKFWTRPTAVGFDAIDAAALMSDTATVERARETESIAVRDKN